MPPTTGHLQLVQFASALGGGDGLTVLITTQPEEPFCEERVKALKRAIMRRGDYASIQHIHRTLPQDPTSPGFRELWQGIMIGAGFEPGDILVTSETYGKWVAEICEGKWMPYDVDRSINPAKATNVRSNPYAHWDSILPEFRKHLQVRVTIFGAESTGKSTLAEKLRHQVKSTVLPEYARPYLENVGNRITVESMTDIWKGQRALQLQEFDTPVIIQDTDLYSTLGYWSYWEGRPISFEQYAPDRLPLNSVPQQLGTDARELKSDLYILCTSDGIEFEPDPLRYGGDRREIDDNWWMDFAALKRLNMEVLRCKPAERTQAANILIRKKILEKSKLLDYRREYND